MAYIGKDGTIKCLRCDTFNIRFNDKFVTYADDTIIVLNQVNYLKLEGFRVIDDTGGSLQKYEEIFQKQNLEGSIVLFNWHYNYVHYQAIKGIRFTKISGNYLHLFLKTNNKKKCVESLKIVKLTMHHFLDELYEMVCKILSLSSLREFKYYQAKDSEVYYFARGLDQKEWSPDAFFNFLKSKNLSDENSSGSQDPKDFSDYICII